MRIAIRLQSLALILLILCSGSISASESLSLDPNGRFFLQKSAGDFSNCGPLVALMARKYSNAMYSPGHIDAEIRHARGLVNQFNGEHADTNTHRWWRIRDIQAYLQLHGINFRLQSLRQGENSVNELQRMLSRKSLIIVNVNMNHLPYGRRAGKPYRTFWIPGGWGHYLAIVGFQKIDDEIYFETHDSFSRLGENRLYSAKQIIRSMKRYQPYYLEINKDNGTSPTLI